MNELIYSVCAPGRFVAGRLPRGKDLIGSVEALCAATGIQNAAFTLIGAVSSATIGFYDSEQRVYVTDKIETFMEIASCSGNVSLKEGKPFVHAHAVLTDENGRAAGGHLFSETIVYAAEIHVQEIKDLGLARHHDDATGLTLWRKMS